MRHRWFYFLYCFTTDPAKAWQEAPESHPTEYSVLVYYVYPLIGIAGLCSLLGTCLYTGWDQWSDGIRIALMHIMQLFVGFHVAAFAIRMLYEKGLQQHAPENRFQRFTAYSFTPILLVCILDSMLNKLFFIQLLNLYACYLIWTGCQQFLPVVGNRQVVFILLSTALVICSPIVAGSLLKQLFPGL